MRAVSIKLPRAARVLDLGCGTGWVIHEAQSEGDPCRVGVDYSLSALLEARRESPGVKVVAANGLSLPFPDAVFDVVIGHVSIPYMNTVAALREIYRVLTPGGSIWLTFHTLHYVRTRLLRSLRSGRLIDTAFCLYIFLNGVLNHFGLPQFRLPWRRRLFETVNTPAGMVRTALAEGFTLISIESCRGRIFLSLTARKAAPNNGPVLPAPGWAVYRPLA